MLHRRRTLSLGVFVLCLLVFAGCGGPQKGRGVLKGTVVLPPNVKLGENDSATVNFAPGSDGGERFFATINPADLTFSASGAKGKGVVPGKYKISVRLQPYLQSDTKLKAALDAINERYDNDNSSLSYTVTEDPEQSITIDLGKGTVTKK